MEIWWIISFFKAGSVPFKEQALLSFCSENMLLVLYKIILWLLENRVLLIYNKYKNWKFKIKNNNSYYLYRYFVIFLKNYFIIFYLIKKYIFIGRIYQKQNWDIFSDKNQRRVDLSLFDNNFRIRVFRSNYSIQWQMRYVTLIAPW